MALRLPRTAFAVGFNLAALRGRRIREPKAPGEGAQGRVERKTRSLRSFHFDRRPLQVVQDATRGGGAEESPDQRFADPVALSSTHLGDFPAGPCGHPRTAFAVSFDLAALRGRRTGESRDPRRGLQGDPARKSSHFAKNDALTFPQLLQRPGDISVDFANAVPLARRLASGGGGPCPARPLSSWLNLT